MIRSGARREYREIPPLVSGYPLDNYRISFYKPLAGVNLISNPSLERGIAGYTSVGGSSSQSALQQRFGVYSLEVTPDASATAGVYYGTFDLSSGQLYWGSVWGLFNAGHAYTIYFANTSGTLLGTAYTFRGTGRWQRVSVAYGETSTASRRIYITKNGGTSLLPFYIDGLQVEADALTSYIDGDQLGFVRNQQAYYWTGTPHASPSVRVLGTRSGGEEVFLTDYGFSVLAVIGLGLGGFANLSTPNAYVGGSDYQRTVYTERTFDIAGVFQADSDAYMRQLRSDLVNVLRPNAGIITQPLMLRIQSLDDCGRERGEIAEIPCALEPSSLAGNWNNSYQDPTTLSFTIYLPYALGRQGFDGAELNYQETIGSITAGVTIVEKDVNGSWSSLISSFNGAVRVFRVNSNDGRLYIGGAFTTPNTRIAAYNFNTQALEALGDPGGQVNDIDFLANGDVIIAMGGAGAGEVKKYDIALGTWSSLGTSAGGIDFIDNVLVGNDQTIYAGGGFTSINAVGAVNIAKLISGTWTPLGAGLGSTGLDAVQGLDGTIYIASGSNGVYHWDGSSLSVIGTAGSATESLSVGMDGRIYAVGDWTSIGGVSANRVAVWNGVVWSPLGDGLGVNPEAIYTMGDGNQLAAGTFQDGGGLDDVGGMLLWNGSAWVYYDIDAGVGVTLMYFHPPTGNLYLVFDSGVTSIDVGIVTVVDNAGSGDTYPVFEFVGPGKVYTLRNYTTGDVLYFDLTLNAGERATLTLGPGNISFTSTFRGNIINTIIPGSSLATFRLTPGANAVSAFIAGTTSSNTRLAAYWKVLYQSFDNSLYR